MTPAAAVYFTRELREGAHRMRKPAKTFTGAPCVKCGSTLRRAKKRRALKKGQRCTCCTPKQFEAFERLRKPGEIREHVTPLEVAVLLGLKGFECLSNLQWLSAEVDKKKTHGHDLKWIA